MSYSRNHEDRNTVCVLQNKRFRFSQFGDSINPQHYPVRYQRQEVRKPVSEVDYALDLLETYDFAPKVFCLAMKNDFTKVFKVTSNQWNWAVKPVTQNEIVEITPNYLEGIGILTNHNVPIRGIALATPFPKEYAGDVIQAVCSEEVGNVLRLAQNSLLLVTALMKNATAITTDYVQSVAQLPVHSIPDPVLLVRLSNSWIEIGRW